MRRIATLPARRLWAIVAAVLLVAAGGGIAQAALSGGGAKPAPKPLDVAVRDALNAPAVPGITARIRFTNHLLPSGSTGGRGGTTPLIAGATGRLWLARDGRARLELQSDNGDAQIVSDGKRLTIYDATSNTVYKAALPAGKHDASADHGPVTLAEVNRSLSRLARTWNVSKARPTSTAGQPSYTVKLSPKDDGGLLGAAQVAWDAARGVPLRAAVYAQGQTSPILELTATDISYGTVAASNFAATPPAGAKVVEIASPSGAGAQPGAKHHDVSGAARVARQLDFPLVAPAKLAGLPRKQVRLLTLDGSDGALSTYGRGLGAIVVVARKADPSAPSQKRGNAGPVGDLPKINIDGATGTELSTALGTVVTFERGGVSYTVAGSVPPVAAENAARGLR